MSDTPLFGGLELLRAVVDAGSFVRAGQRVGLTQSGVSRAIARIEQRVGVRLFDRNARAVVLTDEGRRFYVSVLPHLAALEEALDGAASSATRVRGRLRINVDVDAFFARHVLAPKLSPFLALYPEVHLEVVVRERVGNLPAEGFDVAVRFDEPRAEGLIARRLLRTRVLTCAAPSYLARHRRPRHPRELAHGHACIFFLDPQTGLPFPWNFHSGRKRVNAVPVTGRLTVNDVATGVAACLAGQGVAQLLEMGNREALASGALVNLFPRWSDEQFSLYVLLPSRQLLPAKVRAFLDFLVASAATAVERG